jgi:hypothetical protein
VTFETSLRMAIQLRSALNPVARKESIMKLLSGKASIALKKFPLMALAIAILGIGLSPAALAQTGNGPRTKTESALDCLVGLEPDGCETVFKSATAARRSTTYCTVEYTHRSLDNCWNGPLETVEYLGTDAAKADVYDLRYMNTEATYVIFPAARHGKIPGFSIFYGSPNSIIGKNELSLVTVTSPANPVQTLYSRPKQGN